jgi:exosortase
MFAGPLSGLAADWWSDPDAGHGLLLVPVAFWLVWRGGLPESKQPNPLLGTILLVGAVLLRFVSALAAEIFITRGSALLALVGIVVLVWGWRQVLAWWLPTSLLALSIPLPDLVLSTLALPLQLQASKLGAALLELRHVPVRLSGNIIRLPGHSLFVTEACSGLRSLTALLSLGLLIGGLWLSTVTGRAALVLLSIPVAILINAFRVFLTGFLVFFVSPEMGEGFMHVTEGWIMFVIALGFLGALGWLVAKVEERLRRRAESIHE